MMQHTLVKQKEQSTFDDKFHVVQMICNFKKMFKVQYISFLFNMFMVYYSAKFADLNSWHISYVI